MNGRLLLLLVVGPLLLAPIGCATPPKPPELVAFEHLRSDPQAKQAEVVAPNVMKRADRFLTQARNYWEDNELDQARHASLFGQAKIKHALALHQQSEANERIKRAQRAQRKVQDEESRLAAEYKALNEQVALLEQLQKQAQERQKLMGELQKERETASAEQKNLSQKLVQEKQRAEATEKLQAAELALKEADTVDAKRLAPAPYQSAVDMLARAQQELQQSQLDAARVSADMARQRAAAAVAAAKPAFEQEMAANDRRAQAESLAGEAAQIQSIEVRREARGQLQRLVLHIPASLLFKARGTTIVPGSEAVLTRIGALISKYNTFPVQVVGHTDDRGGADALLARSHARAQSVYTALVSRGVAPTRLVASGQGGAEPVSDNKSVSGRARNNRVEVVFLYQ
ncbi:MAG: OmpA family protein [Deltaproteobacteria bacterium]|nr:OmpA family protein [Deltaproteobacteria bacterium]